MEKNNATAEGSDSPPENSSTSSSAAAAAGAEEQEESGWTDYLEDYFSSESSYLCSSIGSCSNWDHNISNPNYDINKTNHIGKMIFDVPNKLTFKKTRTQKIFEDDSLQDTATSPIHSPKVADLKVKTSHENPRFDVITNLTVCFLLSSLLSYRQESRLIVLILV